MWPTDAVATAEPHHPSSHGVNIHCTVSINFHQGLMNVSTWSAFFLHGRIQFHTTASHTPPCQTLSDCPPTAFCYTATKCNGILVGRFNLYYIDVQPFGLPWPQGVKRDCLRLHIYQLLQKWCLLFISMESTTNTKCKITMFDRANSQLQNSLFQHTYYH